MYARSGIADMESGVNETETSRPLALASLLSKKIAITTVQTEHCSTRPDKAPVHTWQLSCLFQLSSVPSCQAVRHPSSLTPWRVQSARGTSRCARVAVHCRHTFGTSLSNSFPLATPFLQSHSALLGSAVAYIFIHTRSLEMKRHRTVFPIDPKSRSC